MVANRKNGSNGSPSRLEELGLGRLFIAGSKSRDVAEMLLTGRPQTRKQLATRAQIAPTSVVRVVNSLESHGVTVKRTEGDDRQVTYQVPEGARPQKFPPGAVELEVPANGKTVTVKLTSMESDGAQADVTLTSPLGTVRARTGMHPLLATASLQGLPLSRVVLLPGGEQEWTLGQVPNIIHVRVVSWE